MLTRNVLKSLKSELLDLIKTIDVSLSPLTSVDSLFDTQADYYEAMKNENKVPQDFYKFRYFDFFCLIKYNFKDKKYYVESVNPYNNICCDDNFCKAKLTFCELVNKTLIEKSNELVIQPQLMDIY